MVQPQKIKEKNVVCHCLRIIVNIVFVYLEPAAQLMLSYANKKNAFVLVLISYQKQITLTI